MGCGDDFQGRMLMSQTTRTDTALSTEANKRVVRRLFDGAFNQGDLQMVDELWIPTRLEEGKRAIVALRSAFPDYHRTIEAQIAEGALVVSRWTARGTHRGAFSSRVLATTVAPTEARFETPGISIHRIEDGRVKEAWVMGNDSADLLLQLGALRLQTA
jgi:predicted ester cyclase